MEQKSGQIQAARYGVLSEAMLFIAQTADLQQLIKQLATKIKWVLDFERCTLALLEGNGQSYRLQTLLETRPGKPVAPAEALSLAQDLPGWVMQSRQVRLITDVAAARDEFPQPADLALWDGSLTTILSLPLETFGKVLGALTFATTRQTGYNREDLKVAVTIAAHLAAAIDRWQQHQQVQQANQELARLASFPKLNPSPVVELDLAGQVHYMNPAADQLFPECRQQGLQSPVLADLPTLVRELVEQEKDFHVREVAIGDVWYRQLFHLIPGSDRIRTYHIDITERRRVEEDLQRQNQYLGALHATTLGLVSRLDLNELLEAIVNRAGQLLGTPHGFIFLLEPGEDTLELRVGMGAFATRIGSRLQPGEGVAGQVWQTVKPLVVPDYDRWEHRSPGFASGVIGAVMVVPLTSRGQFVGAIGMAHNRGAQRSFEDAEIGLLDRFAQLASLALDNARLFAQTEEQARRLSLLNE
ncbi:MAG TPA: GAF domain-containing protein [Caldilineaceae bacterium]|nr:GAF domain-containing protein [Caldilineaceae bacterium]